MKKKLFVLSLVSLLTLALPAITRAVTIANPAPGLFVTAPGTTFKSILLFGIQSIFLPLVGLVSILFIIIGGFQFITSRGNEEQAEAGKKTLTNAIIGLVIVLLSYTIVIVIMNALAGKVR